MTDGVRIENLHIENAIFIPDALPESTFHEELFKFLREQHEANAFTIIGGDGYPMPEGAAEPDESPTPEQKESIEYTHAEELAAAEADASGIVIKRAKHLRGVAKHVTAARSLEGQRRGYVSSASKRKELERRQKNAEKAAATALEEACVLCEFREDCALTGDDIKPWIDTHAYADKAQRRKDSGKVEVVESRNKFSKDLQAGVEAGKQVHCDPAERT